MRHRLAWRRLSPLARELDSNRWVEDAPGAWPARWQGWVLLAVGLAILLGGR